MVPETRADRGLKLERFIERMEELAKQIGPEWRSDKSAAEIVMEMREEEDRAHWDRSVGSESEPAAGAD